jgi:hypothetical protein
MKAFPTSNWTATTAPLSTGYDEGMDLRDYFAAAALGNVRHLNHQNDIARAAYALADAMMKARKSK